MKRKIFKMIGFLLLLVGSANLFVLKTEKKEIEQSYQTLLVSATNENVVEETKELEIIPLKLVGEEDVSEQPKESTPGAWIGMPIDFNALWKVNEDIVAWIYMPSCNISYPVLHGETNNQYLNTDYLGNSGTGGSLFVETLNNDDFYNEPHSVIYGHSMKNGTMFGSLWKAKSFNDNAVFYIITPEGTKYYDVFSVRTTNLTDAAYVYGYQNNTETFEEFVKASKEQSLIEFDVDIESSDNVVSLSTCHGNGRLLVQGKLRN